jgi:hypothetical protein
VSTCPDKLAAFGITAEPDETGVIFTPVDVQDVDGLRSLLDVGFSGERRQAHFDALFQSIESEGTLLHRVHRFLLGNDELSAEDRAVVASVFPLTVAVTTAPGPITVNSPVDLSSPTGTNVVCFTDVTLEQGGSFTCAATNLSFTCDTLTRNGSTGSSAADFNILGKPGAPQPTPQTPAAPPQAGQGTNSSCSSPGVSGPTGGKGNNGVLSSNGIQGHTGNNGTPSLPATIMIKQALKLVAPVAALTFFGQSGAGGNGGDGGKGGPGQQGGKGGTGSGCCGECSNGGTGGDGGKGGTGGQAGNGGNGLDAAGNITVATPSDTDWQSLSYTPSKAPPGKAGNPGGGGDPGPKGPGGDGGNGSSGTSCGGGPDGSPGLQGDGGLTGSDSTVSGAAPGFHPILS